MEFSQESFGPVTRALVTALILSTSFISYYWLFLRRRLGMLRGWAKQNGFQIVSVNKHYMVGTGPFKASTNSRNQLIYSVVVRDKTGCDRKAWVRCGSYLGKTSNSDIEVKWDDEGSGR